MFCMLNNLKGVAKAQHVRNGNKNEPQPVSTGHTRHQPESSVVHARHHSLVITAEPPSSQSCSQATHNQQQECHPKYRLPGPRPRTRIHQPIRSRLLKQHFNQVRKVGHRVCKPMSLPETEHRFSSPECLKQFHPPPGVRRSKVTLHPLLLSTQSLSPA